LKEDTVNITELKTEIDTIHQHLAQDFDHARANRLHDLEAAMFAARASDAEEAVAQLDFLANYLLEAENGPHPAEEMLRSAIGALQ
jgi:hypothetical protein